MMSILSINYLLSLQTCAPIFTQCNSSNITSSNPYHGILTLANQQKSNETQNGNSVARGPGRPPMVEVSIDDYVESEDPVSFSKYFCT